MDYKIVCPEFEGPLDLLLHLIKESNIDIFDIKIEDITRQYLDYINMMEELNLNIASEYLVMASELLEMKSSILLPKKEVITEDDYEEDPREQLINRLLEYQKYKNVVDYFKNCESARNELYSKNASSISDLLEIRNDVVEESFNIQDLVSAFENIFNRKQLNKPLNTKVTNKEYSIDKRSYEIKQILTKQRRIEFDKLFDSYSKDYLVITFLSILDLVKKQEIVINQNDNFSKIYLELKQV